MKIIKKLIILTILFFHTSLLSSESTFDDWLKNFKIYALKNNISEETFNKTMLNVIFLSKVIEYDRYQPEFYEDTNTYVSKRTSDQKVKKGKDLYLQNKDFINSIDKKFLVEKELLLALMGIETNFGAYVGKMDILSSLATLSFDKRRSAFFTNELITILQLVENDIIDYRTLYGSWAGAFGNFQFMPSTINKYAIDYDGDNKIELKLSLEDSLASAANYINKIGWKKGQPCFYKVKLTNKINKKYINSSARQINYRLKVSKWKKKGVVNYNGTDLNSDLKAALILPDGKPGSPTFLIFENYEKILKWNRSLRFGISVCTLANMIKI